MFLSTSSPLWMSRAGGGAFAFVALSGAFALSDAAGCEAFFDASSSFFLSSAFSFSRSDAGLAAVAFVELSAAGAAAAPVRLAALAVEAVALAVVPLALLLPVARVRVAFLLARRRRRGPAAARRVPGRSRSSPPAAGPRRLLARRPWPAGCWPQAVAGSRVGPPLLAGWGWGQRSPVVDPESTASASSPSGTVGGAPRREPRRRGHRGRDANISCCLVARQLPRGRELAASRARRVGARGGRALAPAGAELRSRELRSP